MIRRRDNVLRRDVFRYLLLLCFVRNFPSCVRIIKRRIPNRLGIDSKNASSDVVEEFQT